LSFITLNDKLLLFVWIMVLENGVKYGFKSIDIYSDIIELARSSLAFRGGLFLLKGLLTSKNELALFSSYWRELCLGWCFDKLILRLDILAVELFEFNFTWGDYLV